MIFGCPRIEYGASATARPTYLRGEGANARGSHQEDLLQEMQVVGDEDPPLHTIMMK